MAHSWTLFGLDNPADINTAARCLRLLRDTSKINRERSLVETTPQSLIDKVNNEVNGRSWVKLNCRKNQATEIVDVVIVYHVLKHRNHAWSVSIGFDQTILPSPDGNGVPGDLDNPYVVLARELSETISSDLAGFSPPQSTWVSIDDRSTNQDGSEPDSDRRKTMIGELGWIAENDPLIQTQWKTNAGLSPKPKTAEGHDIPGYGKPGDTEVYVTEATKR